MAMGRISKEDPPRGVIVAMLTPFREDEELDEEALRELVDHLIEGGVHGLFPNGSIGEAAKMTVEERCRVMEVVVDQANGRVPVIPGTGDPSTRLTLQLTKYAEDVGADAALLVEPYYYRPTPEALYKHYKIINDTLDIPLILYDIPSFTGYSLSVEVIEGLAALDNVVGMKDSSGNMIRLIDLIARLKGRMAFLQGIDTLLLPSLLLGATGGMVGGANIFPQLEVELYQVFQEGDLARAKSLHLKIVRLCRLLGGYGGFPTAYKEAAEMVGVRVGGARMPSNPLKEGERKALREALLAEGII